MDSLSKFQRKTLSYTPVKAAKEIFFQINIDNDGAYLSVIDHKGKELEVSSQSYVGPEHDLLQSMERIQTQNNFRIDWGSSSEHVYFTNNEFLLWQLRHCKNFVNSNLKPIHFSEKINHLCLVIESNPEEDHLKCEIIISQNTTEPQSKKAFSILNKSHILAGETIYQIEPLSENFNDLFLFEGTYPKTDLENYLSIFYSHFENGKVLFQDYQQIEGPSIQTRDTLIFEQIDPEQCIYLRISPSIEGMEVDFFERYDLHRLAVLNEMDHTIQVSSIETDASFSCFHEVGTLLNKRKKALKS